MTIANENLPEQPSQSTLWHQFIPLVAVFFFWGFVAASNDILVPVFKKAFHLTQTQSQLVSLVFYVAYTVGSLLYMLVSRWLKADLLNHFGYKKGLVCGLLISALGTLFFYPAANLASFPLVLSGLFVVGLGFSLQQTCANPLAIMLGDAAHGASRLTLAGGVNNLGTTIGPLIVSIAVFGPGHQSNTDLNIEAVKIPYLILGLAFVAAAAILNYSAIPDRLQTPAAGVSDADAGARSSALRYPQLWMGMLAIFVYVGVEVATASNLPEYMSSRHGYATRDIAPFISLYWASLMIGRWSGAVDAFDLSGGTRQWLKLLAPYTAFAVFLSVNALAEHDLQVFYPYALGILGLLALDLLSRADPARMMLLYSLAGILALLIGMNSDGIISIYAFTSVGMFCSTLWPCIMALALRGLGQHTSQGSNLLIMMIMGGGIISWLQGFLSDHVGITHSYWVGVFCFSYLAFYAWRVPPILQRQGLSGSK